MKRKSRKKLFLFRFTCIIIVATCLFLIYSLNSNNSLLSNIIIASNNNASPKSENNTRKSIDKKGIENQESENNNSDEKFGHVTKEEKIEKYNYKDPESIQFLVNRNILLPQGYVPQTLVKVNVPAANQNIRLRQEAASALEELFGEVNSSGMELLASSAYRDEQIQQTLYNNHVLSRGGDDGYVAPPLSSEHQTGLAIDLTTSSINYVLEESFESTREGIWLKDNAHRFGYILRYPRGKEEITGYKYEPWHFRYVGNELANEIYNSDLTLDEYFDINK